MGYTFVIEPAGYTAFATAEDELEKCKEWGLLSEKAAKTKTFAYKRPGLTLACSMAGFVDSFTAVIAFENGQLHCIHPSYLKEMQTAGFGQRAVADIGADAAGGTEPSAGETAGEATANSEVETVAMPQSDSIVETSPPSAPEATPPVAAPAKEGKKRKLQLPEGKVSMTATVQAFAKVMNHFTEEEDEVVIYEEVAIIDPALDLGLAWSSHSNTLKKLELAVGDRLSFEAKVAAKKLLKHPVQYKINNPAKIQKADNVAESESGQH